MGLEVSLVEVGAREVVSLKISWEAEKGFYFLQLSQVVSAE